MPSGPKKRRADKKKKGLRIILDAKEEEQKFQDATVTTSSHPIAEKETEKNLHSQDLKGANANQAISQQDSKDPKEKHVFATDSIKNNNDQKVVSIFQSKDNIEDDDSNTVVETLSFQVKHAGLDSPTEEEKIQDMVSADIMVNQGASENFPEISSKELPVLEDSVPLDLSASILPMQNEESAQPSVSFHVHNAGVDSPTADEKSLNVVVAQEFPSHTDAVFSDLPASIVPMEKEEEYSKAKANAKQSFSDNVCLDLPTSDEKIPSAVIAENVIDQYASKICTENNSQELPGNDDEEPFDLLESIVPMENEESLLPDASLIPENPDQEEEDALTEYYEEISFIRDRKEMKAKKMLEIIKELMLNNKKVVEEQLEALIKVMEVLLQSLDAIEILEYDELFDS